MSQGQWSKLRAMKTAVFLLVCGCTASASEVEPPQDTLFFPTGLAVAPNDAYLFIANGNSELRYDSGSVGVNPRTRKYCKQDRYSSSKCSAQLFFESRGCTTM